MKRIILLIWISLISLLSWGQSKTEKNIDGNYDFLAETANRTVYVTKTGNDLTGTGLIGAPFLTVGKALSTIKRTISPGVITTVNVGTGTFTISSADLKIISSFSGSGTLSITGTMSLIESGFTMGSAEALDPFAYTVSGGNTASWITNQFKYRYLKSGAAYYPITANTTTSLSICRAATTGTEIYRDSTVLTIAFPAYFVSNVGTLSFNSLELDLPVVNADIYSAFAVEFTKCYVFGTGYNLGFNSGLNASVTYCSFNSVYINWSCYARQFNYNYVYGSRSTGGVFMPAAGGAGQMLNNVLENPNAAAAGCCIYLTDNIGFFGSGYIKFVNSTNAIKIALQPYVRFGNTVILKNTKFLVEKLLNVSDYLAAKILIDSTIMGVPVTRYFYDPMYSFSNLGTSRDIRIRNIIWPEFDQNLSATLTDNTTTNVIVGNKVQNRSIHIDYEVTRGTNYRKGGFDIVNNGTTLYQSPDQFITDGGAGVSSTAIIFNVDLNTNEIRINAVLNSTGSGATLKYNITRTMITPLTL